MQDAIRFIRQRVAQALRSRLIDEEIARIGQRVGIPREHLNAPGAALRSTVEMPGAFTTDTAIESTPRVIQASTISFCLAGSRSVGPSRSYPRPVLWRILRRRCGNSRSTGRPWLWALSRPYSDVQGRNPGRGAPRAAHRLDQPPVAAGHDQRSGDDDGAQYASCEFFISSSVSPVTTSARRPHAIQRRWRWSRPESRW